MSDDQQHRQPDRSSPEKAVLTIPGDLSFDPPAGRRTAARSSAPGYDIFLNEDWDSGIGGGLWTTGLALAEYVSSPHFLRQAERLKAQGASRGSSENQGRGESKSKSKGSPPLRVLELGSGNGFLGVCLVTAVAVAEANKIAGNDNNFFDETKTGDGHTGTTTTTTTGDDDQQQQQQQQPPTDGALVVPSNWPGIEVVVTDTAEHTDLMKATIESNLERILPQILRDRTAKRAGGESPRADPEVGLDLDRIAPVREYLWGEPYDFGTMGDGAPPPSSFDLIVGSDVAYRDHLHDPLIAALDEFSRPAGESPPTVALIGVTMDDTKPVFFEKLERAGFSYERLSDRLFGRAFATCSRQFAVFAVSRAA